MRKLLSKKAIEYIISWRTLGLLLHLVACTHRWLIREHCVLVQTPICKQSAYIQSLQNPILQRFLFFWAGQARSTWWLRLISTLSTIGDIIWLRENPTPALALIHRGHRQLLFPQSASIWRFLICSNGFWNNLQANTDRCIVSNVGGLPPERFLERTFTKPLHISSNVSIITMLYYNEYRGM